MKNLFAAIALFLVFLIVDVVGSLFYHPFHVKTTLSGSLLEPRMFVWDGVLLMLVVYLVLLVVAALRKRFGSSAPLATVALIAAAAAGYGLKLGFVTQNW